MRSWLTAVALTACLVVPAAAAQKKALFDNTKAETAGNADWVIDDNQPLPVPDQSTITPGSPRTTWLGAISSWGIDLVKRGWYVATLTSSYGITYQNANNPYDLSNYDVFIVPEPNIRFTSAESLAIVNYVKDGGGLIAISDHDIADRNNDKFDAVRIWDLMDRNHQFFGAHFDTTGDPNNNISQTSTNVSTSTADSVIFSPYGTVTGLAFHNGSTLTLDAAANSSVRGVIWMTGVDHTSTSSVMAATATYGQGRIFMTCDSSPIDDGSAEPGNSSIYDGWGEAGATDSTLFTNATAWVARRSSGSGDTQPPVVAVTSPAGGETWATASAHNITWTATDNVGVASVDLAYSLNNGASWTNITTGLANTGSYGWTLPGTPSAQAKVRALARDAAGNLGSDSSHTAFTIADQAPPQVAVNSPAGGESWAAGSAHTILWTATDNVGVTSVDLDYSLDNGSTWTSLAAGLANGGSYPWTLPNASAPQAKVRVTAHDAAANSGQAVGGAFAIVDQSAPQVTLTAPVGGESWQGGSSHNITWTATDNVGVDSINADLSVNGVAGPWASIAHGLANTGTYPWSVPAVVTDSAVVRLTAYDHAGNTGQAISDSLFHILAIAGVQSGPARFALARPTPNPSRGDVTLRFSLATRGVADLQVLDVRGRRIWSAGPQEYGPGERTVRWNGRLATGDPAPAGLYFVRLLGPDGTKTVRLVRVQ